MSLKNKLFKEIFSTFAIVDPTQPTKNWKISTQPNPWTTLEEPSLLFRVSDEARRAEARGSMGRQQGRGSWGGES